jgi:DnaJ homolog subfamily A member 2
LDGREIVIKTRPGQVIQCESTDLDSGRTLPYMMMVANEGMPSRGNPFVKGNLYVCFHVKFPTKIDITVAAQLKQLLPDADIEEDVNHDEVEEHYLDEADLRHFGKGGATQSEDAYESDEEGGGGGPVQCQQS